MPQNCLAIQDTVTGLWLIGWDPINQTAQFGNSKSAVCFATEAQRQSVIDFLNQGQANRFIGQNPPPR
jgi:hypothetical protein